MIVNTTPQVSGIGPGIVLTPREQDALVAKVRNNQMMMIIALVFLFLYMTRGSK